MKTVAKLISAFIIGLVGAILISIGVVPLFIGVITGNIHLDNLGILSGHILTIAIGLYLLFRICLKVFRESQNSAEADEKPNDTTQGNSEKNDTMLPKNL